MAKHTMTIRRPNFQSIWAMSDRDTVSSEFEVNDTDDLFTGALSRGFAPGSVITFTGYIEKSAEHVEFSLERTGRRDVALKIEPRESDKKIVFRSCENGEWSEEYIAGDSVLHRGFDFTVQIVSEVERFLVYVHGKKLGHFYHKLPLDSVQQLYIKGKVKLNKVLYQSKKQIPTTSNLIEFSVPEQMRVVFARPLVNGFKPGSSLTLIGLVNNETDRMHVCLQSRSEGEEEADLMFYYNPRFSNRRFNRNTGSNNNANNDPFNPTTTTDKAEMPIKKFQEFTLQINCEDDGFRSYVDGKEFIFFKHQVSVDDINEFKVIGKVRMFRVLYRWA